MVADGEERDAKERVFLFGFGFGLVGFFARRRLAEHVFATLCLGKLVGVRPNVAFPLRGRHERVLERVLEIGIDLGVPPVVVVAAVVFKTRAGVFRREVRGERGDAPLPRLERPLERERRARKQLSRFQGLRDPRRVHDRRVVPVRLLQRRQFGRRQPRADDVRHGDARVVVGEATAVRQHDILQVHPRRVRDAVDVDAHAVKHATGGIRGIR